MDRRKPSNDSPRNIIRTTRLDVAAFLLALGYAVAGVEGQSSTITFAFYDPDGNGEAVILEFYGGAQVPANKYADAQKRVRDLLWEARRRHLGKQG